jgi:hypothetical protein
MICPNCNKVIDTEREPVSAVGRILFGTTLTREQSREIAEMVNMCTEPEKVSSGR